MASSGDINASRALRENIKDLLAARIVVGDMNLPMRYAEDIDAFQIGFRINARTGENLVSEADGGWRPGWYVVAQNGFDDPFFVDTGGHDGSYPVHFARHGAGRWDPVLIAPGVGDFIEILTVLAEAWDDPLLFERIIASRTDALNGFWRDVLQDRQEALAEDAETPESKAYISGDFEQGRLIVTGVGSQKLKVVQILGKSLGLPLKEALALADHSEFEAGSGLKIQLRGLRNQLEALGATVEFRPTGALRDQAGT